MRLAAALLALVLTAGAAACERRPQAAAAASTSPVDDWRATVSPADASTLGRLDQAWRLARAEAEEAGYAPRVEALGPLVDPNAGLAGDLQPAPGDYRCRTVALGARSPGDEPYAETPWGRCTLELAPGGELWLTRPDGPQRYRGRLYPDSGRRLVFLGARASGEAGSAYPGYGETRRRDRVGVFERVAPERWRLVFPWPKQHAKLEILELVP